MAHGGVAHDDPLLLGEPLGYQIAAGDITRRHNCAYHYAHADGVHDQIGGVTYADVGDTGQDHTYAGSDPGANGTVNLTYDDEKDYAYHAGHCVHV